MSDDPFNSVDKTRVFLSWLGNAGALIALAGALAVTIVGEHGVRIVEIIAASAAVTTALIAGVMKSRAWYVSDADLRRQYRLPPLPKPSPTVIGLTAAVLRCEGVSRVIVFDGPEVPYTAAVVAFGGDEAQIRAAIDETKSAAIAVLVCVRNSGPS